MPRKNTSATSELPCDGEGEGFRDRLLSYLDLNSPIVQKIEEEGFCVLEGVLTPEEADIEYNRMWSFVTGIQPSVKRQNPESWKIPDDGRPDPWPCAQRDMFQLHQAGWVFGNLREVIAERVFEPLYRTRELHVSKDGFTLQRPTSVVLGRTPNDHYDQGARLKGLHCIQGSVALTDQGDEDACFQVWPRSHLHHDRLVSKKTEDFIILSSSERSFLLEQGIEPLRVPVRRGTVILWRSDVVHCGAPPPGPTEHFRAVAYVCCLPAVLTPSGVLPEKMSISGAPNGIALAIKRGVVYQ